MAVLVGKSEITQAAGSSTIVATLPTISGGILANDVIIVAIQNGTAASNITENTTSEYTEFGTQTTNDTQRVALFRRIAAGGDTSRTFNLPASGAGSDSICIVTVWRYVDVTGDPIRAVQRTDYAGGYGWSNSSGTISANDGDLLVFLNVLDGARQQRYDSNRVMFVARKDTAAGNGSMIMGMRQLTATATTTAETVYCTSTSEGGTGYVFALKNASGGARQPMVEDGSVVLNWFGSFGDASTTSQQKWSGPAGGAGGNNYALSDIISGTLASLSISTTIPAVTVGGGTGIRQSILGTATSISPIDSSTGIWGGAVWRLPSSVDATGKILRLHFNVDYSSRVGSNGLCVALADGTGKWVAYTLATADALNVLTERTAEIALGNATLLGSSETPSTFDWTTLSKIGIGQHRQGSSTGANAIYVKDMLLLGTCVVTGGGSAWPANWTRTAQALQAWDYYKLADLQGGVQAVFKHSMQIGDNSRPTYWDSPGGAFAFPTAYSIGSAYSQQEWNVNAGVVGVTVNPASTDTVNIASGSAYTETQQALTMSGNSGASTSFAQAYVGFAVTLLNGETYSGMTLSGGDQVEATGASLSSCTVKSGNSNVGATDALIRWTVSGKTQATTTVDVTGTSAGYHVAFGPSVTAQTLNGFTFTGSPGTSKIYSELTSGTLEITVDGTGTTLSPSDVTFVGGSTAVASIVAPQPTLSATVLADTRVVLYNRTTDAELDNTAPVGTSWSKVITSGASSGDVLDLYTFKEGYTEAVATIIYSGADASFAVQQETDDAIQYYRTQESVTDYTTLTEYNFYSPDIYIQADDADGENTLKRLFIFYNGVLTTEDGARYMRGGVTFRSPFDVVINRSVVAMAIDNVSTTHGLHFTDEDTIRVTTDDGSSWIAPPSAPGSIRYAFGVSPGQIETTGSSVITGSAAEIIAAIPSSTANANAVWSHTLP